MRILFFVSLALIVSACGSAPSSGIDHSQMDHNSHSPSADHSSMDHSNMQSSPGAAEAPLELQFIDTMIAHHQGALEMARLAEGRTENKQLQTFADGIINAQEREIAEMLRWRGSRFSGKTPAINMEFPGMHEGMGDMDLAKLSSLKGLEFDLEFIRQMIPHHQGAVLMSEKLNGSDSSPEMKKLASAIINDQKAEIEQMRKWQTDWAKPAQ